MTYRSSRQTRDRLAEIGRSYGRQLAEITINKFPDLTDAQADEIVPILRNTISQTGQTFRADGIPDQDVRSFIQACHAALHERLGHHVSLLRLGVLGDQPTAH